MASGQFLPDCRVVFIATPMTASNVAQYVECPEPVNEGTDCTFKRATTSVVRYSSLRHHIVFIFSASRVAELSLEVYFAPVHIVTTIRRQSVGH